MQVDYLILKKVLVETIDEFRLLMNFRLSELVCMHMGTCVLGISLYAHGYSWQNSIIIAYIANKTVKSHELCSKNA